MKGFSLIECLIVCAILAILVSFALPQYQQTIIRTQRIDGETALYDLALRMEEYYEREKTYAHASIGTGSKTDVRSQENSPGGYYILSILEATDTHYKIQAKLKFGSEEAIVLDSHVT